MQYMTKKDQHLNERDDRKRPESGMLNMLNMLNLFRLHECGHWQVPALAQHFQCFWGCLLSGTKPVAVAIPPDT